MKRSIAGVVVAVVVALSAAACGAGSSGALSATAAKNLRLAVEQVRQAANSGSYSQLQQAVAALKSLVSREEQSGDLSSQRANDILNAADILLQDAKPSPSPSTTTTIPSTTTTIPSTTPSASASTTASSSPAPSGSESPLLNVSPPVAPKQEQGRSHAKKSHQR